MSPKPHVAIVILNWNGLRDTLECLESVVRVNYPALSVILVDNGSTDGSGDALARWESNRVRATLIRNARNVGFTGGCNAGIRRALSDGADYVLLLNNDTVVTPDFLTPLVKTAERDERIGMAGPKIYKYGTDRVIDSAGTRAMVWLAQPFLRGHGEVDKGQYKKEEDVPYVTGCALLVKREVIERIGLLDEDYINYFEDFDWGCRAVEHGYRLVYAPRSVIHHKGSKTTGFRSPFYDYYMTRGRIVFARKRIPLLPFFFGFLPYMTVYRYVWSALALIRSRQWNRLGALHRGFVDGWTAHLKTR